MAPGARAQGG